MQRRGLLGAAAFFAVHLACAIVAAATVVGASNLGRRVLVLHVMLLIGVMILAAVGLARAGQRRWVFAATAASAACFLGLLYLGTLIGHRSWGGGLNYQIVRQYAALAAPRRAPFFIPLQVHLRLVAGALLIFAIDWWAWRFVAPAAPRIASVATSRNIALIIAVYAPLTVVALWAVQREGLMAREPLIGFFMTTDGVFDAGQYSLDRELAALGPQARAEYPRGLVFNRRNVIVVMIDALRADHMSVYGYERPTTPFLDELSRTGHLKRVSLALSTCAESSCGILSTLTSKPFRHLAPANLSLGQLLQDQGYEIYQLLSGNHEWNGLRQAYGSNQTLYFDSSLSAEYVVNDDRVIFEGLDRVHDFAATPAFFQFHLMSVHFAGIKQEQYRQYRPFEVRQDFASMINSAQDLTALRNNYDNGVLQADATLRELFARLDRKGYLANALVVVMADHGEGLGDRDAGPSGLGHVHSLHQEFIHIPLLIYDEAAAPYANLAFATQVDVAPTIVDRLGLPVPQAWEGRSLLSPEVRRFSYLQTNRWNPCYGLIDRRDDVTYKYLRCEAGAKEELYELASDPAEQRNLVSTVPQTTMEALRAELAAHLVGHNHGILTRSVR